MNAPLLLNVPVSHIEENPVALRACNPKGEQFIELMDSIQKNGVLKSITLVPARDSTGEQKYKDGQPVYRIIDGLQRWTASKLVGRETIPAQVLNADEAKVYKLQLIANSHTVDTKPVEFSRHLARIMATDHTMTHAQLCKELSKSPTWLTERLGLERLDPEIGKLVDEGKMAVSNATELSKLAVEDQHAYLEAALNEPTAVFGPKVKGRIKEIRDAQRQGRKAAGPTVWTAVPHLRKFKEVEPVYNDPTEFIEGLQRKGISQVGDVVREVFKWVCHMDEVSVAKAKADADARKKAEEEEKARRKQEREAQKAREAAAIKDLREREAVKEGREAAGIAA